MLYICKTLKYKTMKTLISFIISFFIITNLFSQIYSIEVNRVKMHIKKNNVNYEDVINYPDEIIDEVRTNTKHVLDITDSTCSFYYHGVHVNTVPIIKFENVNNVLHFVMEDYDVNGLTVHSNFIIDTINNNVFYHWFNKIQMVTKVEIKTDFKVSIN